MRTLWKLVKKDLKLLVRSKASALIMILSPMLLLFIVGLAFDTANVYSITVGVYAPSDSPLSENFIKTLGQTHYTILRFNSEKECAAKIKEGIVHTCIVFPASWDFTSGRNLNEIVFYVDYSRVNLVWNILETLSGTVREKSQELSLDFTETLVQKLGQTRAQMFNAAPAVSEMSTKSALLLSDVQEIRAGVSAMKFDITLENVKAHNAAYTIEENQKKIADTATEMQTELGQYIASLNATRNALGPNSASYQDLSTTLDGLVQIERKLSLLKVVSVGKLTELKVQLEGVENSLSTLAARMERGQKLQQAIDGKLESNAEVISSMTTKLEALRTTMNEIDANLASLKITSSVNIANPITTRIVPLTAQKTNLNYVFPTLIILVLLLASMLLAQTLVLMEKHSPAYFRNFTIPVSDLTFLAGTFVTCFVVVMAQLFAIMLIAFYFFGVSIVLQIIPLLLTTTLLIILFIAIGMAIGYMVHQEETSLLITISLATLLFLLSDFLLPVETFPPLLRSLVSLNPVVIGQIALKKILVYNLSMTFLASELFFLALYAVVAVGKLTVIARLSKRSFFTHVRKKKKAALLPVKEEEPEEKNDEKIYFDQI